MIEFFHVRSHAERRHGVKGAERVASFQQLVRVSFMERSRNEENDIVDHVGISGVVSMRWAERYGDMCWDQFAALRGTMSKELCSAAIAGMSSSFVGSQWEAFSLSCPARLAPSQLPSATYGHTENDHLCGMIAQLVTQHKCKARKVETEKPKTPPLKGPSNGHIHYTPTLISFPPSSRVHHSSILR